MNYKKTKFVCRCGFSIETFSNTKESEFMMETCSQCHQAFTGNMQDVNRANKTEKFTKKFGKISDII